MAYGDYQDAGANPTQSKQGWRIQPGENTGFMPPNLPHLGSATTGIGAAGSGMATSPFGNGQMPQGTRQQALQTVQQAYATPMGGGMAGPTGAGGGRMPGDMGYLNQLLGQSAAPVSASDPTIAPAFAAGRVADQRNIDRQRAALAEQLGASGLGSSGAMQTKVGGIQQRVGEQQALRESGMLYDEGNARRNALLQGLGLDQSRYQGDNELGYRLAALEAQLNQGAMQPFF